MYKELPLLNEGLKRQGFAPLEYVALKGFSHYPCLRLVDKLMNDGASSVMVMGKQVNQAPSIAALLSFVEQTEYDDMDGVEGSISKRCLDTRSPRRRGIA